MALDLLDFDPFTSTCPDHGMGDNTLLFSLLFASIYNEGSSVDCNKYKI